MKINTVMENAMKNIFNDYIKRHSIKKVIIQFILLFSVASILLLTSISSAFMSKVVVDSYLTSYMKSVHSNFEITLSNTLTQINLSSLNITTWLDLYNLLLDNYMGKDEKQNSINVYLNEFLDNHSLIYAVDIITNDGDTYRCSKNGVLLPETDNSFLDTIKLSAMSVNPQSIVANGEHYIAFGTKFRNHFNRYDIGYLILYIRERELYSIYQDSLLPDSTFFILSDGYIISHSDKSAIGSSVYIPSETYNNEKLSISRYSRNIIGKYQLQNPMLTSNVSIVTIISSERLYKIVTNLEHYTYFIFIFTLILAILIAFVFTQKLLNQYAKFKKNIVEFTYDPTKKIKFKSTNELYELEESFNTMVKTINNLMAQNSIANEKQRDAEIRALQAHINPHFIYNALDTITCQAKMAKQPDIERTSYALASFFRIGLSGGERLIPLKKELEHINSYLTVQQIRFPGKFDVNIDIPEELLSCKILKVTLQPLVENCIKHAFHQISYKGKILITGTKNISGDTVIISISDNGIASKINPLSVYKASEEGGYGIYNVQQRLRLEYGENYGLFYEINEIGGTTVTIRIKYIE